MLRCPGDAGAEGHGGVVDLDLEEFFDQAGSHV